MKLKSFLTGLCLITLSLTAAADAILEVTYGDEPPLSIGVAADYMFSERTSLGVFESLKYKDGMDGVEMYIHQGDDKHANMFLFTWKELVTVMEKYTFGGNELITPHTSYYSRKMNVQLNVGETSIISKDKDSNAILRIKRIK